MSGEPVTDEVPVGEALAQSDPRRPVSREKSFITASSCNVHLHKPRSLGPVMPAIIPPVQDPDSN